MLCGVVALSGINWGIMYLPTTDAVASPNAFRKLFIKIAYLVAVVPAILLFFGLIVDIPN
jgi:hypothetical protein